LSQYGQVIISPSLSLENDLIRFRLLMMFYIKITRNSER
jgi:hypothetical protein